jgi:hypothetical protein
MDEKQKPKEFEVSYWQWLKGENAPNLETTTKEITLGNDEYLVFESGSQVNKKLIDDYIVQIPSLKEPRVSIENYLQKQRVTEQVSQEAQQDFKNPGMEQIIDDKDKNNLGNAEIIPHPDDAQEMMRWENKHKKQVSQSTQQAQTIQQPQDPLIDLLKKSKKEKVKIKLEVDVELPSNLFLQILLDSYEDKKDLILNYTLNLVKNKSFDEELKKFIEKYMENESKQKR